MLSRTADHVREAAHSAVFKRCSIHWGLDDRQVGCFLSAVDMQPLGQRGGLPTIASLALALRVASRLHPGVVLPLSPLLTCPAEGFCSFLLFQPYLFSLGASFPLMASAPASVFLTPVSLFRLQFFSDPTWGPQGLLSCNTSRMNALSSASANPVLLLCLCHG